MADILIRNLSDEAVTRIDMEAREQGISRNELLRRRLEQGLDHPENPQVTQSDWQRFSLEFGDLSDPEVMEQAWQ